MAMANASLPKRSIQFSNAYDVHRGQNVEKQNRMGQITIRNTASNIPNDCSSKLDLVGDFDLYIGCVTKPQIKVAEKNSRIDIDSIESDSSLLDAATNDNNTSVRRIDTQSKNTLFAENLNGRLIVSEHSGLESEVLYSTSKGMFFFSNQHEKLLSSNFEPRTTAMFYDLNAFGDKKFQQENSKSNWLTSRFRSKVALEDQLVSSRVKYTFSKKTTENTTTVYSTQTDNPSNSAIYTSGIINEVPYWEIIQMKNGNEVVTLKASPKADLEGNPPRSTDGPKS